VAADPARAHALYQQACDGGDKPACAGLESPGTASH
jgi:hypothetical protein